MRQENNELRQQMMNRKSDSQINIHDNLQLPLNGFEYD